MEDGKWFRTEYQLSRGRRVGDGEVFDPAIRLMALGLFLVVVALIMVGFLQLGRQDAVVQESETKAMMVTVEAGDSLWSIAAALYPTQHTGEMVHKIRDLNPGIDPGTLRVGQMLIVP